MKYASLDEEKKLWKKGFKCVAGLDEAGRGPLAGPVVAGAVMVKISNFQFPISNKFSIDQFLKLRDSKKLSAKQREEFYKIITNHPEIKWGVGVVSEKIIDKINILEATKLAMVKAVKDLETKHGYLGCPTSPLILGDVRHPDIDFLILDGNFKIDSPIPQKSIIKADEKVFSCAAASIIAKVTRDRIMMRYHKKYPQYGFDMHKGYGTSYHFKMLEKHGFCKIHRKSFYPVSQLK